VIIGLARYLYHRNIFFASITKVQAVASAGDTVYIMGGFNIAKSDNVYIYVNDITMSRITYEAYSMSDMLTFDFSGLMDFIFRKTKNKIVFCIFRINAVRRLIFLINLLIFFL
jgi:hypothetical protein